MEVGATIAGASVSLTRRTAIPDPPLPPAWLLSFPDPPPPVNSIPTLEELPGPPPPPGPPVDGSCPSPPAAPPPPYKPVGPTAELNAAWSGDGIAGPTKGDANAGNG